jgi:peptidoglycan/xylan/chitin deacetylase (PgdA/CDA1 family)
MVEALIVLLSGLLVTLIELAAWRALRGPARGRAGAGPRAAVLGLVTVPLVGLAAWNLSNSRDYQFFGGMVNRVETSEPVVALTFDDGPQPEATDEILAILGGAGVHATFFVTVTELLALRR